MSKFNSKTTNGTKTKNFEGGEAFTLSPESELVNLVSTCLMYEPKFYGDLGETEEKIFDLAKKVDPKFVLQVANYARNELNLRSVPMFLLAIGANRPDSKQFVRKYTPKIVNRADELYESIACYSSIFGKPFPNSLKKGIADCFPKFDEYQFNKYDRKGEFTLKDVIKITHPKEPQELLKKIMNDTLETAKTWETQTSSKGSTKEVWEDMIMSNKMGYMATLKNLRNILQKDVSDEALDKVIAYISNDKAVRKSKQFPFRFFTAYRMLAGAQGHRGMCEVGNGISHDRLHDVLDALEEATMIAFENTPKMNGTTLIACDVSSSMFDPISEKSVVQQYDIGLLLGSAVHKYTDKSIVGIFGNDWKVTPIAKKSAGIISNVLNMREREGEVGYSTNGYKVIKWLNDEEKFVDRILIFTDGQMWNCDTERGWSHSIEVGLSAPINKEFQKYKQINPNVKLYLFDLSGYGNVVFPEHDNNVVLVNGWSEKVFKFIEDNENKDNVLTQIQHIKENF